MLMLMLYSLFYFLSRCIGITFGGLHELEDENPDSGDSDISENDGDRTLYGGVASVSSSSPTKSSATSTVASTSNNDNNDDDDDDEHRIDEKAFVAALKDILSRCDGVEGALTRLVPPPSNIGPNIKKKEWFILYNNALYYFTEKPNNLHPISIRMCSGYFELNRRVDVVLKRSHENGFDLINSNCFTMNQSFCAENKIDKLFWITCLNHFISRQATAAYGHYVDSMFRHNFTKQFLESRVAELVVHPPAPEDEAQIETFLRPLLLESSQDLSSYFVFYSVLGGLFNVDKWTEKMLSLSNKSSDYWLFFVGGRVLCNQELSAILNGLPHKNFGIEDFSVEKVTDEKKQLDIMEMVVKSIKLTQRYSGKTGSSPFTIDNLITIVSEMKLIAGQSRLHRLKIYDFVHADEGLNCALSSIPLSQNIISALKNHYFAKLFGNFGDQIKSFTKYMALPGEFISKENQMTDSIVILEDGAVELSKGNVPIGTIKGFFVFYDWSVFYQGAHLSSLRAITKCQLIKIDRRYFKAVINKTVQAYKQEKIDGLAKVKLLENLSEDKIDRLADLMTEVSYNDGEDIIKQGDPGDAFYLLRKGACMISKTSNGQTLELSRLKPPAGFGEMALMNNQPRGATIKAVGKVDCFRISKEGFLSNIGDLVDAETESFGVKTLKKMDIFEGLSDSKMRLIARSLERKKFSADENIITQGEVGDCFYVIALGDVSVQINHVQVAVLSPGHYFGEMALLNNDKRGATIAAITAVECLCIDKANFQTILGPLAEKLRARAEKRKEENSKKVAKNTTASAVYNIIRRKPVAADSTYDWGVLSISRTLFNGQFSSITLAVEKTTLAKTYILKSYDDNTVETYSLLDEIESEVRNQQLADNHFFVSLFNNTRVEGHIVLHLQYIPGENLARLLHHHPKKLMGDTLTTDGIPMKSAVFYLANILYAIEYLHELDIVHRDISPENIMVDMSGQIKVLDFSCSRRIVESGRLYTVCGKPEYLAPEMVLMNGYTFSVDVWSLGILFYELLNRKTPFLGTHQNDVILNIMTAAPHLDNILDEDCKHFLTNVLNKKMSLRMGLQKRGLADLWNHPLIVGNGYTADKVATRTMPPPLVLGDHALADDDDVLDNVDLDFDTCHDFVTPDVAATGKK